MENPSNQLVQVTDTGVHSEVNSIDDAKLAIKELKIKKKEYALTKKLLANQQKQLRAEYTNEVRTRGSMVKGRGAILGFARSMQSISRDNRRAKLAKDLAPLEQKKMRVEKVVSAIDDAIIKLEAYILNQQSTS